jgi:small subunit ribosomal protein S1
MLMNEDSEKERENIDQSTIMMESETDTTEGLEEESSRNQEEASSVDVPGVVEQETSTDDTEDLQTKREDVVIPENAEEDTPLPSETVELEQVPEGSQQPSSEEPSAEEENTDASVPPLSIESLEEAYDNSIKAFTEGEIVKGTVVEVSREEVMIDIGFKSEGYIPSPEFEEMQDGLPSVHVGDQIDVYIVRREDADGQIVLSKKLADQTLVWDEIGAACEEGRAVEGQVVERIKGGLRVDIGSLRAFLPASQIELRPVQNLDKYVGMTLELKVVKLNRRRHNIVLSRRTLLEEELSAQKAELLDSLEVGQTRDGVVKNITSFGAFVDLGGIDGLLHKTDMSWKKVNQPSEIVSIGDQIDVIVIGIDHEKEKISLGLKQKTPDPWEGIEERYPVGSTVSGAVVNIVNYGVFLELEEGVEGLIHVSEMSWTRRNVAPSKFVAKDDTIEAIVLDITKSAKRISLGLKQLEPNPWELLEQKYPIGTKIVGGVRNLTDFGAFIEIEEGIDGLIHISDLSWVKRDVHPREVLKEGDEVEVMVLQIDSSEQRVSLGLKQIEPDPWLQVPEKYKIGSVVRGEIVNLTSFGAFSKLEDAIEGLIHISELSERRIEKPEEIVSIGDQLDLKVIHLDVNERRIGLSLKAALAEQERATVTQYQEEQSDDGEEKPTTLGALLQEELDKPNPPDSTDSDS